MATPYNSSNENIYYTSIKFALQKLKNLHTMNEKNISKEPVDLWELTEHLPDFEDEYEIWEMKISAFHQTLGNEFTGSFFGYVEPKENIGYNYMKSAGHYDFPFYTAEASEAEVWIIAPKSKEQLLSCVAEFYKRKKKVDEAPNIVGLSPYLEKTNSIGKITDAQSFTLLWQRKIDGKERPTATKKKIEEYRAKHSEFTDERLTTLVEAMLKDFDSKAVAHEVVKELYREGLPLTEKNFNDVLKFLYDDRKIIRYYKKYAEESEIHEGQRNLIKKIYKDANERTTHLSEYPEFSGELKKHLEELADERGNTLAQTLSSLLNVEAMYQTSDDAIVQRNYLNFNCYQEPNGDVIFTKEERTGADYDKDGEPTRIETQAPLAPEPEPEQKKGCLGSILFFLAIAILLYI